MTLKKSIKEFGFYLGDYESLLDRDHKHVADKIAQHWGYEEFYPLIRELSTQNRSQSRSGFSSEVMLELYELNNIHDRLFPCKKPTIIKTLY